MVETHRYALQVQDVAKVSLLGTLEITFCRRFTTESLTVATKKKDDRTVNPRDRRINPKTWPSMCAAAGVSVGKACINTENRSALKFWQTLSTSTQGARFVLWDNTEDEFIAIMATETPGVFDLAATKFAQPSEVDCKDTTILRQAKAKRAKAKAAAAAAAASSKQSDLALDLSGRRWSEEPHAKKSKVLEDLRPAMERASTMDTAIDNKSEDEEEGNDNDDSSDDSAVEVSPVADVSIQPAKPAQLRDPRRRPPAALGLTRPAQARSALDRQTPASLALTSPPRPSPTVSETSSSPRTSLKFLLARVEASSNPKATRSSRDQNDQATCSTSRRGSINDSLDTNASKKRQTPPPPPPLAAVERATLRKPERKRYASTTASSSTDGSSRQPSRDYTPYTDIGYHAITHHARPAYQMFEAYGDLVHNAAAAGARQVDICYVPHSRWRIVQVDDDGVGFNSSQVEELVQGNVGTGRLACNYRSACISLACQALIVSTLHNNDGDRLKDEFALHFLSRRHNGEPCGHVSIHQWKATDGLLVSPAVQELLAHTQERCSLNTAMLADWVRKHRNANTQGTRVLLADLQLSGSARDRPWLRDLKHNYKTGDVEMTWLTSRQKHTRPIDDGLTLDKPLAVDYSLRAYLSELFLDRATAVDAQGRVIALEITLFGEAVERVELRQGMTQLSACEFTLASKQDVRKDTVWRCPSVDVVVGFNPKLAEIGVRGVSIYSQGRRVASYLVDSVLASGCKAGYVGLVNVPEEQYERANRLFHRGHWFGLYRTDRKLRALLAVVGECLATEKLDILHKQPKRLQEVQHGETVLVEERACDVSSLYPGRS
eukprot:TRINITY_DN12252_c3_g2_i1.p1 TRINITY_DN12252_c3_g2~~TRINITY_DN12252_c3_g2_i1.p1  ORF type:complete len:834 (+),score=124.26 TRINITY_DN12252_c3_g2_i1:39-2540(+)